MVVDLRSGAVAVRSWGTLDSLAVRVRGGPAGGSDPEADRRLTTVLDAVGVARVDGAGDALVPAGVLRELADAAAVAEGRALDDGWDERFAGMLAYAASRGWIDDDGAVRAHVEWRDA